MGAPAPVELAVDEVPPPPLPLAVTPVPAVPELFLTGRWSQSHPEVMAIIRPKVVANFSPANIKDGIEDVEFMVMGLILNNWLLIKVSKVGGWGVGLSTFRIIPLPTMIWPFY